MSAWCYAIWLYFLGALLVICSIIGFFIIAFIWLAGTLYNLVSNKGKWYA